MDRAEASTGPIKAWSFSRLIEDYEICPYKAFLLYVEKRPRPEPEEKSKKALERGKAVHKGAEDFIQGITAEPPPELAKVKDKLLEYRAQFEKGVVQVEQEWGFDYDWNPVGWLDDNCWLRVKQDVFIMPEPTFAIVEDWKTGKKVYNEIKHAQQGQLYGISALMKYPKLKEVEVRFTYVDQPRSADTKRVYDRKTLMRMLPSWNDRARKMTSATEFPAKPSKVACRFCPYSPNPGGDKSCPAGVEV
jgi:CRISPR/Cas system-associated exonuclease Cas4 (RecB family)